MSTHTALARRGREQLAAARSGLAGMSRWRLLRWLILPGLFLWGAGFNVVADPWHVGAVLLAAAALLARYRRPATALLVVALSSAVPTVIGALPFLAYGAGRRIAPARRAVAALVGATLAACGGALVWSDDPTTDWQATAALVAGYVTVVILLPAAIGAIGGERARRVEALRERNAVLEQAQRLGDLRARMQERARIAGEMHDLLGHRLSLISLYAGALELRTRDQQPALNAQADLIRGTAGAALDELREVLGILRVDTGRVDDEAPADGVGTHADIEALVVASRAAGQPVTLDWAGDDLTGADVRVRRAVHRVVRESLTNVHKHAPQAPTRISVRRDAVRVVVEVRNPLRPPPEPPPGTGLGLVGLQERARLVSGTVSARRGDGEFVVTASLPLTTPAAPPAGGSDHGDPHIDHEFLVDRQTPRQGPATEAVYSNGASPRRSTDTMSKPAKIILACLIGVVVLACAGGTIGAYVLGEKAKNAAITPAQFAAVQPGQTREQVKATTGDIGSIGKLVVDKDQEPPIPAGATCDYAASRQNTDTGPQSMYRFCYTGDRLVEKKEIIVPGSSTTR